LVKFNNINQVSDHFEDVVKDCIKQTYADWLKDHYSKLWHLQSILDELKVYLPTNGNDNNLPEELWQEVKKKFDKIISWAQSIKYTSEELSLKSLSNTWQKGFNDVQYSLPEIIKLEIRPTLLQVQPEDKNGFKIRKKIYRAIKNIPINIYGSKSNFRKIELHNFLTHYLEVSITDAILTLWQQHLEEVAEQYQNIFDKISELKEKVLFIDDLNNLQDPFEKFDYFEKIFTIAEILNQTDIILHSMRERENHIDDCIEEEWKKTSDIIEFCWQYAGTYILPNKKYRPELLSYNKKIAEKNFKKYVTYWRDLFAGIRANWIKNLEIFTLQLNVVEEFRKSSKTMIINNEVILNPAFENILSSIEKEDMKFNSKITSDGFLQRFTSTQNEFYKKFKNQFIPELIDSIYQTQIIDALENFMNGVSSINDKISETHQIYKFHKNGSITPRSKTHLIEFQQVIKNEIIHSKSNKYFGQIEESKNRLKGIIRALTEINHVYELNWDSVNNLIKRSKDQSSHDEALSIIKTSFKRSREIINKSWLDSKESLQYSQEILLNKSLKLYKDYQSLINTEQLIESHLKLKRDKSQIQFHKVFKKLIDYLKYFFTDFLKKIIKGSISFLKKENLDYVTNFEKLLAQNSKQLKQNLLNLPSVYRRLFMLDSENDTRFYSERKNVTEQIKDSYQRWENADNVIPVVLGETGSGKTSSLNFIEKNLFADRSIIRINLKSHCTSETEFISILHKSFNIKNIKSLDNLQGRIKQNFDSQIVIIDNLHNLYLKTPSGFELIEKFLLFIQQTQQSVFWIFSCSLYSWMILDKVIKISQYINLPIYLENFSSEDIKYNILERHKISGHEIVFETNEAEKQSRHYKKLKLENKHQEYLENKYFNELYRVSKGNLTVALKYWLTSINEFKENKMSIKPISPVPQKQFEQLKIDDFLSLTPFISYKELTATESSVTNRVLNHQNILTLNRLISYGLLEKFNNNYSINTVYYTQIKNILLSKKYLYNNGESSSGKKNIVKIDLYLPVKIDTMLARKIAFHSVAVSNYIDLNTDISVNFINKIFDGVSVYNIQIECGVVLRKHKDQFVSQVTEMILSELMKQGIISQEDFYN